MEADDIRADNGQLLAPCPTPTTRIDPKPAPEPPIGPARPAHVGLGAGAVTLSRSVSSPRPSNRACILPDTAQRRRSPPGIRLAPRCSPVPEGSGSDDDSEQVDQTEVVRGR